MRNADRDTAVRQRWPQKAAALQPLREQTRALAVMPDALRFRGGDLHRRKTWFNNSSKRTPVSTTFFGFRWRVRHHMADTSIAIIPESKALQVKPDPSDAASHGSTLTWLVPNLHSVTQLS